MIMLVFCWRDRKVASCVDVRFERDLFVYLCIRFFCAVLSDFSKSAFLSSRVSGAGGGFHFVFFLYICLTYSVFPW
jgi:hypothetical protein